MQYRKDPELPQISFTIMPLSEDFFRLHSMARKTSRILYQELHFSRLYSVRRLKRHKKIDSDDVEQYEVDNFLAEFDIKDII